MCRVYYYVFLWSWWTSRSLEFSSEVIYQKVTGLAIRHIWWVWTRLVFVKDQYSHLMYPNIMHKSCKRIMTEKRPRCRICVLSDASGLKYYFSETTTSFSKTIRNFRGKPSFSPFCLCSSMLESLILLGRSIAKLIQQNMTASNANVKTMTSEVIP